MLLKETSYLKNLHQILLSIIIVKIFNVVGIYGNSDSNSNLFYQFLHDVRQELSPEEFIPPKEWYDFIVVGAGSAGCVIANRLTEVEDWEVLLIEAGGDENVLLNDVPLAAPYEQLTPINWNYKSKPSNKAALGLNNNQTNIVRGKIMGGSSVLNYMAYVRGNKLDYDNWESLGNTGWGYEDILPYFKKSEGNQVPGVKENSVYHSTDGPLTVTYPPYRTPLAEAFVRAGLELGEKYVDYNGESQIGYSYLQATMKDGTRWSATRAFIDPVRSRQNLHIMKRCYVTKILLGEKNSVIGVEFVHFSKKYIVKAQKEVVLTAGAINSPQLLMLSGIGPSDHLVEVGIPVVKNLSVGFNLMDHVGAAPAFYVNDSVSLRTDNIVLHPKQIADYYISQKGPLTIPGGAEALAFLNLNDSNERLTNPGVELFFFGGNYVSDPFLKTMFNIRDDVYFNTFLPYQFTFGWMAISIVMHPKSRGRILLRNSDPFEKPITDLNYFSIEDDINTIVSGIKATLQLSNTKAFQKYGSAVFDIPIPTCSDHEFGCDEYWRCYVRQIPLTIHHESGTCKMGPSTDPDAVVDPRLKVYGIRGLRIADASVIPVMPACHTNAVVYMIAEKAADLIKEDWRTR